VADTVVVAFLDDGHWSACFGLSLRDLYLYDAFGPQQIVRPGGTELRALTGTGQVPANRNKACRDFLDNTDGDWLWMVDTDMGFASDTVERLVKSADPVERPVMGGLCFAALNPKPPRDEQGRPTKRHGYAERFLIQPTVYLWTERDGDRGILPILDYPRDEIVQCKATGAACLLIHRSVLVRMREKFRDENGFGDVWFDPITHPTARQGKPRHFSEDISFCIRLAAADIPLHVDTAVRTTHEKGFLFLDEDTFDQQQTLLMLEREVENLGAAGS
jgi:hypothetical protein